MIALITGASAGIGKACAKKFVENGYDVIVTGRRTAQLQAIQQELEAAYPQKVLPLTFDIQNKEAVLSALSSLPTEWKEIDVLVNNAGLALGRDSFQDASLEDMETMLQTNVSGLIYVTKAIVEGMKLRKKGHIINLSSTAGKEVYAGGHVYCATKHAVDALTKGLRIDLLPFQIKVTSISPGMVETEFSKVRFKGNEAKAKEVYQGFTPLYAEDVAEAIYYAASLPAHVNINDMVLTCTAQANSFTTFKQ